MAFLANDFVHLGSEMNKATWAETNMGAEEAIRAAVNTVWGSTACYITENQIIHYHGLHTTVCFKHTIGNAVAPQTNSYDVLGNRALLTHGAKTEIY